MSKTWLALYYHLIWSTSRRRTLIRPEMQNRLYQYVGSRGQAYGYTIYAVNGMEDHLHVVAGWGATVPVAEAVQKLKGSSSHFMSFDLGMRAFQWQQGYAALTVSEHHLEVVIKYVKNQKNHHANRSILPHLERLEDEDPRVDECATDLPATGARG